MKTKIFPQALDPQAALLRVARTQYPHPVTWQIGVEEVSIPGVLGEPQLLDLVAQQIDAQGVPLVVSALDPETGRSLGSATWTRPPGSGSGGGAFGSSDAAGELVAFLAGALKDPATLENTISAVARPLRGDVSEKQAAVEFGQVAQLVLREEVPPLVRAVLSAELDAAIARAFERAAPAIAKTVQLAVDHRIGARVITSDPSAAENPALLELGRIGPDGSPELLEVLASIAGVEVGEGRDGVWSAMGEAGALERLKRACIEHAWIASDTVSPATH